MLQIHKASAGSGKTYTLTRKYLQLLLGEKKTDGPHSGHYRLRPLSSYGEGKTKHHGSILAVTFTNKATEEMISRIVSELAILAGNTPGVKSPYLQYFLTTFNTDPSTLATHAATALRDLLFNYSWFNVSTIDSFFQRVLNTFTRELDISPSHALELDDSYPIEMAVGSMLSSVNINIDPQKQPDDARMRRHLTHWLEEYMKSEALEGDSFNIFTRSSGLFRDLVDSMRKLYTEKYRMHSREINEYLADPQRIVQFAQAVADTSALQQLRRDAEKIASHLLKMDDPMIKARIKGSPKTRGVLQKIIDNDFKFTDNFIATLADPMSAFNNPTAKKPLNPAVVALIESLYAILAEHEAKTALREILMKWVYYLGLFGHVQRFLDQYRNENDTLLLSDTGDLLARIIDEQETPFIYERMGTAIRHYLIDEFQDTSLMQWQNLRPLVLESLAHDNDNLIIGDEKQCIYRFRNSDPTLLGTKVEQLVNSRFPLAVDIHGISISENCNWRSAPTVVIFNNSVFAAMARLIDADNSTATITKTYSGLIQKTSPAKAALTGYVKAFFLSDEEEDSDDGDTTANATQPDGPYDSRYPLQLRLLKREIIRQLKAGYSPRDIAVLVRFSRDGKQVIEFLMDISSNDPEWTFGPLQITSSDSMSVDMSPAVMLIVNALRTIAEPSLACGLNADSSPNAAYLRYRLVHRFHLERYAMVPDNDPDTGLPLTGPDGAPVMRPVTTSEALIRAIKATSPEYSDTPDPLQQQIDSTIEALGAMDSPTLIAITDTIISRFITPEARRNENPFITAFQDLVVDFSENGENSIRAFLEWWDRSAHNTSVQTPDGLNAIKVMTVHKSKGLEFPCVHVPFFSSTLVPFHIPHRKSIGWFKLSPDTFPTLPPDTIPPLMPLPNSREVVTFPLFAEEGAQWVTEQKTDALNVAYVALTRAGRELCVYVDKFKPDAATDTSRTIGNYLHQAITRLSPGDTGIIPSLALTPEAAPYIAPLSTHIAPAADNPEVQVFAFGSPTTPEPEKTTHLPAATPPPSQSAPDTDPPCLTIQEAYGASLDQYYIHEHGQLKASTDFEDLVNFSLDDERHKGIFLHDVLSRVEHRTDLTKALRGRAYRYRIPADSADYWLAQLQKALDDPRVAPWFEGYTHVVTEREITDTRGTRRPDRMVLLPSGELHIVDYKFGNPDAEHNRRYRSQLRDYIRRMRHAGYTDVRGFLWYPLAAAIHEIKLP